MSQKKLMEDHACKLGKLIGNLQTIEMAARMTLVKLDAHSASMVFTQLPSVKEGDLVELNVYTNKNDLTKTLQQYNKKVDSNLKVDVIEIVKLRDALAHGRTFGVGNMQYLRLLKFSRDNKNNKVMVEMAVDMTPEWFVEKINFLLREQSKITKALNYNVIELQ